MVKKRGAPVWSAPLFLCPQIKNRGPLFQRSSILMVNAKTFRTMKKSSYLRIMVDPKGIEPSNLTDANRALSQLSYGPLFILSG